MAQVREVQVREVQVREVQVREAQVREGQVQEGREVQAGQEGREVQDADGIQERMDVRVLLQLGLYSTIVCRRAWVGVVVYKEDRMQARTKYAPLV